LVDLGGVDIVLLSIPAWAGGARRRSRRRTRQPDPLLDRADDLGLLILQGASTAPG